MKLKFFCILSFFLIALSNLPAQTWTLQTSPVTTDLNGAWAVDGNVVWMCGPSGVVIKTTNGGTTWSMVNAGLTGNDFYTISAIDANIAEVGASDGRMWRTTNGGANWTLQILTPAPTFIDVVHFFDSQYGFALSDPAPTAGLWLYYITTDAGANWEAGLNRPPNAAGEAGWNGGYAAIDTGHIWWGTNASKIWKGGFRGPFSSASTTSINSLSISFNDALTGLAGMTTTSPAPILKTTDGGITWSSIGFTPLNSPFALKYVPGTGFCWLGTQNIYRTANNGSSWNLQLTLTSTNNCYCLAMTDLNTGWAGTQAGHIYKYHDIVGIDPNNTSVPKVYSLQQNYPNPFNPTTNIKYSIPVEGKVSIIIYDALGNEVRTLVSEFKSAGNYVESFDASNISSGIYFYTLRTGDFVQSKKMLLIK